MKRTTKGWAAAAIGGSLLGLGIAYVLREKATPGPDYRVLVSENDFEIRVYPAITVAETIVPGERKAALSRGFKVLADYIFAKSREGEKLAMRVPVFQDGGNPMASDPPLFDDSLSDGWRVRFTMPADDPAVLPPPPRGVSLFQVAPRRVGAVRFSGVADDAVLDAHEDALRGWLARHGETEPAGAPEYAFYNSPMIPPPLRRSEVLLPLA
jgi:SOUL heme-binding protein